MPEVRFYVKEQIFQRILRDAQNAGLTLRQYLQTVVESAYDSSEAEGR